MDKPREFNKIRPGLRTTGLLVWNFNYEKDEWEQLDISTLDDDELRSFMDERGPEFAWGPVFERLVRMIRNNVNYRGVAMAQEWASRIEAEMNLTDGPVQ